MKKRIIIMAVVGISVLLGALYVAGQGGVGGGCESSYEFQGMSCEDYKEAFLKDADLYITFSERPRVAETSRYWVLPWKDIDIVLPATEFEHVVPRRSHGGEYGLVMKSVEGAVVTAFPGENTVFDDIFATWIPGDPDGKKSREGIASTNTLYGGPVSMSEILTAAYEITPDSITCCKERYIDEIGKVIPLILKNGGPGELVAVYRNMGGDKGWMTKRKYNGSVDYQLNIIPEGRRNQLLDVGYRFPDDKMYSDIPFMVGRAKKEQRAESPGWLVALSEALKSDSKNHWNRYLAAAREAGISEKSLSQTLEAIELKGDTVK